ncbi:hypothetical protein AUJ46_00435 [Candidatus Peregrinibacteria bacterium CG1_02_54_53]|nr:MAG: hypothetical protein AUJ46_00435 [Candidatus Peregrinibacteria bacterium CG1_02_54_53]
MSSPSEQQQRGDDCVDEGEINEAALFAHLTALLGKSTVRRLKGSGMLAKVIDALPAARQAAESEEGDRPTLVTTLHHALIQALPPELARSLSTETVEPLLERLDGLRLGDGGEGAEQATQELAEQVQGSLSAILHPKPVRREAPRVGRNAPCPCGSGKKYKKCCQHEK